MSKNTDHWTTAIAHVSEDDVTIRGYALGDLVGSVTLTEMVFIVWQGRIPERGERELLDAMLVSVAEHGISPTSVLTRTLASCGVPIQACMSGGLLSLGDVHGGAGELFGEVLSETVAAAGDASDADLAATVVERFTSAGERVPGYGHPHHPDEDPRTTALVTLAEERGLLGRHTRVALAIPALLGERLGRGLPLNVDGATAPLLLDLGFSWRMARPLIFTARSIGLAAHAVEEVEQGNRWRHVPTQNITYSGPVR